MSVRCDPRWYERSAYGSQIPMTSTTPAPLEPNNSTLVGAAPFRQRTAFVSTQPCKSKVPTAMDDYLFDLRGYIIIRGALTNDEVVEINTTVDILSDM